MKCWLHHPSKDSILVNTWEVKDYPEYSSELEKPPPPPPGPTREEIRAQEKMKIENRIASILGAELDITGIKVHTETGTIEAETWLSQHNR